MNGEFQSVTDSSNQNRSHKAWIWVLLFVFVGLSAVYSVVVPPFEASDELWHYPMVKYIADHWALPAQDPENVGAWRQEGSQPPLYYFIGAVATFWIDTSDLNVVRHLNPHADNGATPDGNVNLITHNPDAESFPWRGTTLAVHLVRFLSVVMSATTVYLTYRLSLELLPARLHLALAAAAINAFIPMFVFISGAVNNDNLVVPLCSLALLLIVRLVKRTRDKSQTLDSASRASFHVSRFVPLGVVVGLAILTKESAGGLILLSALAIGYIGWHERSLRTFVTGGLAAGAPTILIAGWWYFRNLRLYGDLTGQNAFIEILGQRDVPADLAQLWRERVSFIRGYWGNFGGLNVPMSEWVYVVLNVLLVLATLGLLISLLVQGHRRWRQVNHTTENQADREPVSWFLVLLWPALVVGLWIVWATTTWSSQGRLVFPAISVWSLLLALGWLTLIRLLAHRLMRTKVLGRATWAVGYLLLPTFLLCTSLLAPFVWIGPAYARPRALTDDQVAAISQRVDATFFHPAGGQLKLIGYDAPVQSAFPGQSVPVTLFWEAIEPFAQDYSIFVHLVDDQDLIAAQRDALPGMGTLSTQWLAHDRLFGELETPRWAERRVLTLPDTAFSPNQTVFEVGLYNHATRERLEVVNASGEIAGNHVRFGHLEVQAPSGPVPNPVSVDFGGEIELVGYDLDRRALRPGELATLTLYWRGQRPMATNYSISTQFVDKYAVKAAQMDAWPLDGAAPTAVWEPGNLIQEARELVIFDGIPSGVYDVYVAVYPSDAPESLLVVTPSGGRLQTDHIVLTTIRVLP